MSQQVLQRRAIYSGVLDEEDEEDEVMSQSGEGADDHEVVECDKHGIPVSSGETGTRTGDNDQAGEIVECDVDGNPLAVWG